MKKSLLLFLVILLCFSCKKERTIHITAKNVVTGAPYAGLRYTVVKEHTAMFEEKYKTVASGTLNENGEAYITKRLNKNDAYTIRVEEPPNCCYNKNISLHFGGEEHFEAPFEFAECAYLKLSIHNVNCQGGDKMVLYQGNQVGSFNFSEPWEHDGCALWESNGYSNIPMGEQYYKWEVTRNNITNTYYDTIYLSAGEYKTYEINY